MRRKAKVTKKVKEMMWHAFYAGVDHDDLYVNYALEIPDEDDIVDYLFEKWFEEYYKVEE